MLIEAEKVNEIERKTAWNWKYIALFNEVHWIMMEIEVASLSHWVHEAFALSKEQSRVMDDNK